MLTAVTSPESSPAVLFLLWHIATGECSPHAEPAASPAPHLHPHTVFTLIPPPSSQAKALPLHRAASRTSASRALKEQFSHKSSPKGLPSSLLNAGRKRRFKLPEKSSRSRSVRSAAAIHPLPGTPHRSSPELRHLLIHHSIHLLPASRASQHSHRSHPHFWVSVHPQEGTDPRMEGCVSSPPPCPGTVGPSRTRPLHLSTAGDVLSCAPHPACPFLHSMQQQAEDEFMFVPTMAAFA